MVEKGYEVPTMVVEGTQILKPKNKWDETNMKETPKCQCNECLVCALSMPLEKIISARLWI